MSYHGDSEDTIGVDPQTGSLYHNICTADNAMPAYAQKDEPKTLAYMGNPERRDEGDGWYV